MFNIFLNKGCVTDLQKLLSNTELKNIVMFNECF